MLAGVTQIYLQRSPQDSQHFSSASRATVGWRPTGSMLINVRESLSHSTHLGGWKHVSVWECVCDTGQQGDPEFGDINKRYGSSLLSCSNQLQEALLLITLLSSVPSHTDTENPHISSIYLPKITLLCPSENPLQKISSARPLSSIQTCFSIVHWGHSYWELF